MKHIYTILISAAVSLAIHYLLPARLPDTIRCDYLEAGHVKARWIATGYLSVHEQDKYGMRGTVNIIAGPDYAGINVSDGKTVESFWVEERFGLHGVVEK